MATYGQVKFAMGSYGLYRIVPHIHFGKADGVSPSTDLDTMALHVRYVHVAANCSRINCLCYFSLRVSMNYTENPAELLVHAQTVNTRCSSSPFEHLGMRLSVFLPQAHAATPTLVMTS